MTTAILKEKVDTLEQHLLAICSLNDICQQVINEGNRSVDLQPCAELLNHLIEPAMYKVEEVRVLLAELIKQEFQQPEAGG